MKIYFSNVGFIKYKIAKVLNFALKSLGQPTDRLEMSLSVVSPEEIRQLNQTYREVDSVTDVLSFPISDTICRRVVDLSVEKDIDPQTGRLNLGDVIICLQRAKEQAADFGHSLKREMCFLSLHGLLHLLGYDHMTEEDEAQMTALQKEILQKAGIGR